MNKSVQAGMPVNTPFYVAGGWGFVSGITGRQGDNLVPGGFEAEFSCVLAKLRNLLEERALGIRNIAKVNLYLADMQNRDRLNEMYLSFFGDHLPARTVVGVTEIARQGAVELEAVVQLEPVSPS